MAVEGKPANGAAAAPVAAEQGSAGQQLLNKKLVGYGNFQVQEGRPPERRSV